MGDYLNDSYANGASFVWWHERINVGIMPPVPNVYTHTDIRRQKMTHMCAIYSNHFQNLSFFYTAMCLSECSSMLHNWMLYQTRLLYKPRKKWITYTVNWKITVWITFVNERKYSKIQRKLQIFLIFQLDSDLLHVVFT